MVRKKVLSIAIFILVAFVLSVSSIAIAIPENSAEATSRVFVSGNPASLLIARNTFAVHHDFEDGFTVEVSAKGLAALKKIPGIETKEVQLYHVLGKPVCPCDNDGICEPEDGEHPSCCDDCKGGGEEESRRTCYPDSQSPWGVGMVNGGSGGTGVDVAILDTGVYREHLDLTSRITQCKDFTKGPKVKNSCRDDDGHGTHVAGIIAADGGSDGEGIIGVAPAANILAYKVCGNDGLCWADDIAAAIDYAGSPEGGAEIVSMSLGGDTESSLIRDAINRNHQILYVAAAGNDGPEQGSIDYPGANMNVIAVGAIDSFGNVPDWSSRGINNGDYVIEEREVEFGAP
jgi:subtilisin